MINSRHSFSLIELLVVIAIVGILAGIIIVSMTNATDQATLAKAKVFSSSMRDSMAQNMVSEWKFDGVTADGSTATLSDLLDTWGINNGTAYGGPIMKNGSNCVFGNCLSFDGVDDYISVGTLSNFNYLNSFTIALWVKLYKFGNQNSNCDNKRANFIKVGSIVEFGTNQDGLWASVRTTAAGNWYELFKKDNLNQWKYVVLENNSSTKTFNMYVDGSKVSSRSYSTLYDSTGIVTIGGLSPNCNNAFINGLIDDIRIYNAALPSAQIKQQYYAGLQKLLASKGITEDEYNQRLADLGNYCLATK